MRKLLDILSSLIKVLALRKATPTDVAELCKSNTVEAYNLFWRDDNLVRAYLEPARIESYLFIVRYLLNQQNYGSKIVDIGFGSGDFLRFLKQKSSHSFEIHGLDYSIAAVERAKKNMPEGYFITGDIYNLAYAENFFDQVFCIQTLEHLKNPEKVIKEMDRICKPEGRILISIPNGELDNYEGHVNFWNEAEFKKFLAPRHLLDFFVYNENRAFMASMKPLKG